MNTDHCTSRVAQGAASGEGALRRTEDCVPPRTGTGAIGARSSGAGLSENVAGRPRRDPGRDWPKLEQLPGAVTL
jgi:hypothetical protein